VNENIITWNFVNWITILLMAAVGFLVLAGIGQVFHRVRGTGENSAPVGAAALQ
jgi:hypothetical protein